MTRTDNPVSCFNSQWFVLNNALMTALAGISFFDWRKDTTHWGRLVEVAVGDHLINTSLSTGIEVFYWLDRNKEVDFVLRQADNLLAIEVKSGLFKSKHPVLVAFVREFPKARTLLVGQEGIPNCRVFELSFAVGSKR